MAKCSQKEILKYCYEAHLCFVEYIYNIIMYKYVLICNFVYNVYFLWYFLVLYISDNLLLCILLINLDIHIIHIM